MKGFVTLNGFTFPLEEITEVQAPFIYRTDNNHLKMKLKVETTKVNREVVAHIEEATYHTVVRKTFLFGRRRKVKVLRKRSEKWANEHGNGPELVRMYNSLLNQLKPTKI